jgi:hypothetical protein
MEYPHATHWHSRHHRHLPDPFLQPHRSLRLPLLWDHIARDCRHGVVDVHTVWGIPEGEEDGKPWRVAAAKLRGLTAHAVKQDKCAVGKVELEGPQDAVDSGAQSWTAFCVPEMCLAVEAGYGGCRGSPWCRWWWRQVMKSVMGPRDEVGGRCGSWASLCT